METEVLINQLGLLSYLGIWFISIISNVFIPIPEEGVLLVLGYLSGGPKLDGMILFAVVLSGLLISDIAMYFFSRRNNKHINKVIFFSRFLVQLRFLGPFFAGQGGVPFRKFFAIDFLALMVYVPVYLLMGRYFRSRIEFISNGIGIVRNIIIVVVLFAVLVSLLRLARKRLLKIKPKEEIKK
jgi:membrane protein DedA with SNARE-associated domain